MRYAILQCYIWLTCWCALLYSLLYTIISRLESLKKNVLQILLIFFFFFLGFNIYFIEIQEIYTIIQWLYTDYIVHK